MRVLLQVDLEGISEIRSYRELWPIFTEFWELGRSRLTDEVVAAALGLQAGGASEITLVELHGPAPVPITLIDRLPTEVTWRPAADVHRELARGESFDAAFQLGMHARSATPEGFVAHTEGLNLHVAIDGKVVSEAHLNAWRAGAPLLGITGDAALESQLDRALQGTPFLATKRALSRGCAEPLFNTPQESGIAVSAFTRWCIGNANQRPTPELPERFTLSLSMPPRVADRVEGQHDLRRTSPSVLALSVTDWWYEAEPAIQAVMHATYYEWNKLSAGVEIESAADLEQLPTEERARLQHFWEQWIETPEPKWRV